jgi:glycosyltransferase involved in cell wall biosynthesis
MIHFTLITCTFNAKHELQRTLDSVLQQEYADVEHIIQDGLSKDGTVEMALHYKQESDASGNGHTVRVCSEKDGGLYDAMNRAIQKATGHYLVFLNAGDALPSPDTLENIAASVGDGEQLPGVLYGGTDIVDAAGHFVRHRRLQPPADLSWKSFRHGMLVCHQAFYARTDLARQTPYDLHYRLSADFDWCIRIMKRAQEQGLPLKDVGFVVANYLEGGMSVQNHRASLMERFRLMYHHYGFFSTVAMHLWFVLRSVIKK